MSDRARLVALTLLIALGFVTSNNLFAGIISAQGSVTALTNVNQLIGVYGTATFDEPGFNAATYSPQGMTFKSGNLSSILPGVTTPGTAIIPYPANWSGYFPGPIGGGGQVSGLQGTHAGVATFSTPVTQFGLTAGYNGDQWITAWDTSGNLIGSVHWEPAVDASFVGIDTGGVAIGMIAYGNDDLYNGATYGIGGATIMSDNWMWASGSAAVPEPASLAIWGGLGIAGLVATRRRKKVAA